VFDHDDRVARIAQPEQKRHEFCDVVKVKAGSRLIEKVEGLARRTAGELRRKLDALRLAAGKRRGGLAKTEIAEADIHERLQLVSETRHLAEELVGLGNGHVEHLCDVLPRIAHFKRLLVETPTAALFAGDVDVRQKTHLKLADAIASARLATPALHVEAEAPRRVPTCLCTFGLCKEFTDVGEESYIGSWIGTWGASDGGLVDLNNLVEVVITSQLLELLRLRLRAIETTHQLTFESFIDQCGLTRTRHARNNGECTDRNASRHILEVVSGAA